MKEKDLPDHELVCYCEGKDHRWPIAYRANGSEVVRKKCFCGKRKYKAKKRIKRVTEGYQGIK